MWLPGTYHNGFAPRDGMPRYPQLWRGCVGAWNPGLGSTGATLRDWSGRQNHGTLTDMDIPTAWASPLKFDTTNDSVTLPNTVLTSGKPFSITWWENGSGTSNTYSGRFLLSISGSTNFNLFRSTDVNYSPISFGRVDGGGRPRAAGGPSVAAGVGTWACFTLTGSDPTSLSASNYSMFVDGVDVGTTTGSTFSNFSGNRFGSYNTTNGAECRLDGIMVHNRRVTLAEHRLLSLRRGIAYELAPRRRAGETTAAAFQPSWAYRSNLLLSSGGQW